MDDRHLAGIHVSPQFMYTVLHGWQSEEKITLFKLDWPIDAIFMSCNWVVEKQAFLLIFEHESFPVCPEGCHVEILKPEMAVINAPKEVNEETK